MERNTTNKLKILAVRDIMERCCGRENAVTMTDILTRLHLSGISAERKSVYDDLAVLRQYGIPIVAVRQGHGTAYYVKQEKAERSGKNPVDKRQKVGYTM